MALSREDILGTSIPQETVDVPEWGGKVILRGLTASERDAYEQDMVDTAPNGQVRAKRRLVNVRASLVVRCVINEDGEREFSDDDIDLVGNLGAVAVDRLWDVCRRLSGLTTEDEEKLAEGFGEAQADTTVTD